MFAALKEKQVSEMGQFQDGVNAALQLKRLKQLQKLLAAR